ncbi:hypothetical protein XBFFL1_2430034 [Xenorhabdus bovienii str. feltiae Florida]|uniref:Uncharacterized protein n=1 Tax=Xenorhabdus bovienii str. kraussei Becker Underwood TaxID=1398204 RepID=A0A077PG94_XENBV|nr:hypothetical protein XBFFR1_1200034 [Xenorhabdus bovienii str. feltiae France]CDG93237.1 hypothetical protein XBFFL1_2430034 [Xenorhabdus bovienii str. feltiae Florida]CDH23365.1 hypothetical protein XBKB1_1730017 [Xenorhabdus bovienii str. kraussei Becker Underwood]
MIFNAQILKKNVPCLQNKKVNTFKRTAILLTVKNDNSFI